MFFYDFLSDSSSSPSPCQTPNGPSHENSFEDNRQQSNNTTLDINDPDVAKLIDEAVLSFEDCQQGLEDLAEISSEKYDSLEQEAKTRTSDEKKQNEDASIQNVTSVESSRFQEVKDSASIHSTVPDGSYIGGE